MSFLSFLFSRGPSDQFFLAELLATSCKPVTIYTHECQVVTVQSSTTTEIMTTEAPPVPTIETTDTVTTHTMTSGIVVSSTTTTEETPEPTDDTVVSAAAGNELCMKLSAFAFGLAVLYSV